MNISLQKKNDELAIQKDILAREHYESDKFFRILLQSANDGISFYDKDWNLKFSNSAFYSLSDMIGSHTRLKILQYSFILMTRIIRQKGLKL